MVRNIFVVSSWLWAAVVVANAPAQQQDRDYSATAKQCMVATVHPLATDAALAAYDRGGNAIDAAVAAALTLGVVDGYNSGIGGGCFILIRRSDGSLHFIDGRDLAPLAATRDMYVRDGKADTQLSQTGPLAVAVPGALAGYEHAVRDFGRRPFNELILQAASIADEGFEVSRALAGALAAEQSTLQSFPGTWNNLLQSDGRAYMAGEIMRQPDLAASYRAIAKHGIGWFYGGPFAEKCAAWMKVNGGILTVEDFANYRTVVREPIRTTYRDFEVIGIPPPSSGGVHVAQILNIVENFDLSQLSNSDPATFHHIVIEAMKLAFADRAHWLGDSDFVPVPRGLIDKSYAKSLAAKINTSSTAPVFGPSEPPDSATDVFRKHTTHIAAADADGNWVAITTTVNTTFGSKVVVPGTGIVLNNQMDDFAIAPGEPNAFGLVGSNANAIAPGKRPLSSMSPTIVLKDGQPVLTVGAAGGPTIISQVVWTLIRYIDQGLPLDEAIAAPRLHHQWSPDRVLFEPSLDQALVNGLDRLGHDLRATGSIAVGQAICFDPSTDLFSGVHDPRAQGKAAGR